MVQKGVIDASERLSTLFSSLENDLKQLKLEHSNKSKESDFLKNKLLSEQKIIQELKEILKSKNISIQHLRHELDSANGLITKLQTLNEGSAHQRAELKRVQDIIQNQKLEIKALKEHRDQLKKILEKSERNEIEKELKDLRRTVDKLSKEKNELAQVYATAKQEVLQLSKENLNEIDKASRAEVEAVKERELSKEFEKKYQELLKLLSHKKAEFSAAIHEINALKQELRMEREKQHTFISESKVHHDRVVAEYEKRIDELIKENELYALSLKSQSDFLKDKLVKQDREIKFLKEKEEKIKQMLT